MRDLMITLGHNSSAVVAEGSKLIAGFETERLTHVKSDSAFPTAVISRLNNEHGIRVFDKIFVGHWEPHNDVNLMSAKHWDPSKLPPHKELITQESLGLTHHDCHAYAAVNFAQSHFTPGQYSVLVVDGFGTMGEHVSFYDVGIDGKPVCKFRIHGYETSIGLMYQYATQFLGMKMHEDEYKLLGYQSKLANEPAEDVQRLNELAHEASLQWIKNTQRVPDPSIGVELRGLGEVSRRWHAVFDKVLKEFGIDEQEKARVYISHFVQTITEKAVQYVVDLYQPTNLVCAGGVFMNVALNMRLVKTIPGKFCVYPLAGDQGNAIGIRAAYGRRTEVTDLRIGLREIVDDDMQLELPPNFFLMPGKNRDLISRIADMSIRKHGFVNIVRGDMEFGPRALCNTTTLAQPLLMVAHAINKFNGRNSVMPFAPVMKEATYLKCFPDAHKVALSEEFMIVALEANPEHWNYPGASLMTHDGLVTARPQVYREEDPEDVVNVMLQKYTVLINTSFNVHGRPIVLDLKDAIHCHEFQCHLGSEASTIFIY